MSIASNFPAIKPTLLLDFANTEELDSRVTFTRASTATYYGTETAKAEENLLLQSQTFDNASWTKSNAAVSGTNTIVAPDGTTTAEEVRDGTATNIHSCFQAVTLASGTTYVASVFLKNVDRQYAILAVSGGVSAYASAKFDLIGGTSTANQAGGAGWSVTSVAITPVGSDWYRCVLVFVSGTSGTTNVRIGLASDGTTFTTNGSGLESYTGTDLKIAVWGAQLEQRSAVTAYTPTTTQTITNYIPQLLTAASGVARFDHNPTTFESLGLLIEESRTNLFTYSEQFDNAAWSKTRSSITADTVVAPDGTLTGDKLVEDTTAANTHQVASASGYAFVSGTTYVFSVYAKAAEKSWIYTNFHFQASGSAFGSHGAYFNLATGTTGTATNVTSSIQAVGNGWYRCTIVGTASASLTSNPGVFIAEANGDVTIDGDGYSGIYIWGAQLEAGAFATSYIPTVASQVTRAADAASMTGTNFSSWYNAAEGTMYAEANTPSFATTYVFAEINNNSTSNYIRHSTTSAGTTTQFVVVDGTVTQASPGFAVTLGSYRKMAGAYTANSVQQSVNGSLGTEDTSATIPTGLVQINIGSRAAGTSAVNGTIRKIAYYPLRVTNAQLQGLTS